MSGGTGMAGIAVTGLVAAVVAMGVSFLVPRDTPPAPPAPPAERASSEHLRSEVARLRAEIAELRAARAASPGTSKGAVGAPGPGQGPAGAIAAADPAVGGEAPLPASRAELVALIDDRIQEKGGEVLAGAGGETPGKKKVSIEEAGAAIGLSAFEIDAVRRVYANAESEMLNAVMGTTDIDAIRQEVRAAKEDPEKKAALVNKAVGNVFRNLGHVMTLEDRRDRELKKVIPEEKAKALKDYDLKPTFEDAELEDLLKDVFEN